MRIFFVQEINFFSMLIYIIITYNAHVYVTRINLSEDFGKPCASCILISNALQLTA